MATNPLLHAFFPRKITTKHEHRKKTKLENMIRRLFEKLKLVKPRQPHLPQTNVSSRFVLLKGVNGNVFWTTDDGSDHEKDGFTILHRGTDCNEMTAKWEDYYRGRL